MSNNNLTRLNDNATPLEFAFLHYYPQRSLTDWECIRFHSDKDHLVIKDHMMTVLNQLSKEGWVIVYVQENPKYDHLNEDSYETAVWLQRPIS